MPQATGSTLTRRALPALIAAVTSTVAFAPAAHGAATVSRVGSAFTLTSDAAADVITMRPEGANDRFVRFVALPASSLTPGAGCNTAFSRILRRQTVVCGRIQTRNEGTTPALTATLGAGDDVFKVLADDHYPRVIVDGGEGDDELHGSVLSDDIDGGPGDDEIHGWSDADDLGGGAGDDLILGDGDADHLTGGPGRDELLGDGRDGAGSYASNGTGGDSIDATDFPTTLAGLTPEQLLAIAPEPDVVQCGPGLADTVVSDGGGDVVSATCEATLPPNTVLPPTAPVFPFAQTVLPNPGQRLSELLTGHPFRFAVTASAGGLVSAKLSVSAADARRLGLGRGPDARTIAFARPVLVGAAAPSPLALRVLWDKRAALRGERGLRVTVTVTTNHANETASTALDTTTTAAVTLER